MPSIALGLVNIASGIIFILVGIPLVRRKIRDELLLWHTHPESISVG